MNQILLISHHILVIGGAVSMILLVILLIYMLVLVSRGNTLIKNITQTYSYMSLAVLSPFRALQKIFEE